MLAEAAKAATDASGVIAALQKAASATGSDFSYLLSTAQRESSLKPQAQSGTSSAAGLFQFVEQTWLGLVKTYGAKYGLSSMAGAISKDADGRYRADNPADRQAILALRKDPQVASLMEGEFANQTRAVLESQLGRGVCGGELYAAHFLGPDAACKLIRMSASQPGASAAGAFPQAANANKSVFFHADGTAKTVREVYDWALKQPGGSAPLASSAAVNAPKTAVAAAAQSSSAVNSLMSDMSSWTPSRGFFADEPASGADAAFLSQPFLLAPGVMDVLSSMSPVAQKH